VSEVFGSPYAHQYDALYGTKDYAAECDAVEALVRRHGTGPVRTLLDLGCGTGTHAFAFARRGYSVTGADRSPAMLEVARGKAAGFAAHPAPVFVEGDLRTLRLGRTFDAVVMLFAVLGYQTGDDDVATALHTVATHLAPGGMFVCDLWYGPAVLATGMTDRVKVVDEAGGQLHRAGSGTMDKERHTCRVDFRTWRTAGGRVTGGTEERHTMRYFFVPELEAFFGDAGLELCAVRQFDDANAAPDDTSWNVWVAGRKRAPR
jgi:SAM-dependent methyltransferase